MPCANENHRPKTRGREFPTYIYDHLSRHKFLAAGAVLLFCAIFFLAGARYSKGRGAGAEGPGSRKILHYVDPMNPAHTSPEPGLAPCGMRMEPVYADGEGNSLDPTRPPGSVKLNAQRQQLLGVRVAAVEKTPYAFTLRALGKVAADETRIYLLNAAIDGWIRETYANTTGMVVKKDEPLAAFYSPEFLTAQQSFIYALGTQDRYDPGKEPPQQLYFTKRNIKQAADSLRNLGMSDYQIGQVARERLFAENILIVAPATSYILARNISPGQRFVKGFEWYRLADLGQVWVLTDVYENEAQYIHPGDKVKVIYRYQKKTMVARVSEVPPVFDPSSRTLKVRLEIDNPDYLLRPDMFVDVELPVTLPPTINVPVDAVLDSGLKQTVFVERGDGYFEPRKVETGWRLGDRIEITQGLKSGEKIVVSGNFLIDSESRMKLAAAGMFGETSPDPTCGMYVDESKSVAKGLKTEAGGHIYYFCSDQCKGKFDVNPTHYLTKSALDQAGGGHAATSQPQPQEVMPKDPVYGLAVDAAKAKAAGLTAEYQGKVYYFCSDNSKQRFIKAPQLFGNTSPGSPDQAGGGHAATSQPQPQEMMAKDPVYGVRVDAAKAKAADLTAEYRGQVYYFCSDNSKQQFNKAPHLFGNKSPGPPDQAAAPVKPAEGIDLVCGTDVRELVSSTPTPRTEYKGTIYYFCSEHCKEAFNKEPERYLSKSAGSRTPAAAPEGGPAGPAQAASQTPASSMGTAPVPMPPVKPPGIHGNQPQASPKEGALVAGVPKDPGYDIRGRRRLGALKAPASGAAAVPGQAGQAGEAKQGPPQSHQQGANPMRSGAAEKNTTPFVKAEDIPIHFIMPPKASAVKDPVCDINLDDAQAKSMPWKSDYQGKTYFFCSEKCKKQFDKSPTQFLNQTQAAGQPPAAHQLAQPDAAHGSGSQHD